jgi:hypothetical protein
MPEAPGWTPEEAITLTVTEGQFLALAKDMPLPGEGPTATHKIAVGPFYLPGAYQVVAGQRRTEHGSSTYLISLVRVGE